MNRYNFLFIFFLEIFIITGISGSSAYNSKSIRVVNLPQDTLSENQNLYNGRIWKNLFYMVEGDQFLFSNEFLSGSLSINSKLYPVISIKYDIYNDEILTPIKPVGILQLNKEMVDSFSLVHHDKRYHFIRMKLDSMGGLEGFVHVLYKGKAALYIKYNKKIDRPGVVGRPDYFYQANRIYFVKDGIYYQINRKNDLFRILKSDKASLKDFMKRNSIRIFKKVPDSFISVIRYYDTLSK